MHGERQHLVRVVKGGLHAVAMMSVDIHVHDLEALCRHRIDGHHGVVEDAEARGVIVHGVVQAPGDVESHVCPAFQEKLGGLHRCPGGQGRGVVHSLVSGVVAVVGEVEGRPFLEPVSLAEGFDRLQVLRSVE